MPLPRRLHHTTPALGGVGAFRLPCYASSRSGPNSRVSERARVERFLGDRPAMQDAHRCMVQMDSARTERYHIPLTGWCLWPPPNCCAGVSSSSTSSDELASPLRTTSSSSTSRLGGRNQ